MWAEVHAPRCWVSDIPGPSGGHTSALTDLNSELVSNHFLDQGHVLFETFYRDTVVVVHTRRLLLGYDRSLAVFNRLLSHSHEHHHADEEQADDDDEAVQDGESHHAAFLVRRSTSLTAEHISMAAMSLA